MSLILLVFLCQSTDNRSAESARFLHGLDSCVDNIG
jgi:hypothetical protein